MPVRLWTVWLSWTYEIFIDPPIPVDRLSAGPAFIDLSFRKPTDHRSDVHAHLGNL